ncbi:MAG: type II toxin-antitoxin system VapC family toxin [Blastochloris sp.]|nr:type II toxin-antitoxin system VapC family toxin [Blastochloris sp.]
MKEAYFDSTYLFKVHCVEYGTTEVRACAATMDCVVSALHGRAEFASACHRKMREKSGTQEHLKEMLAQLEMETHLGALRWLPITKDIVALVESIYQCAPAHIFLRASDALHLACAAHHGFKEIYSNDQHLLAAAPLFGLKGLNIIPLR